MILNPQQQNAVEHDQGHALVVAGPGSGKTRTLTARIAYLIGEGVPANQTTAITFTNKAAREIKKRLSLQLGEAVGELNIGTFHAVGLNIIRSHGTAIGLMAKIGLLEQSESLSVMRESLRALGIEISKKAGTTQYPVFLGAVLREAKMKLLESADLLEYYRQQKLAFHHGLPVEIAAAAYQQYEKRSRARGLLDFDDLIMLAVKILKTSPEALEDWKLKTSYLLVDEFQDSNSAQYELIKAFESANVMVIGDAAQAIYSWRGGNPSIFEDFEREFTAKRFVISQNYRSSDSILAAANAIMKDGLQTIPNLVGMQGFGKPVQLFVADDAETEAQFIAGEIARVSKNPHANFNDFAVLYRTNIQSRALEQALARAGVPYKLVGGSSFWSRIEVKICISFLRLVQNPANDPALEYLIEHALHFKHVPDCSKLSLGESSLEKIKAYARQKDLSLLEAFGAEFPGLKAPALNAMHWLYEIAMPKLFEEASDAVNLLTQVLEAWGYIGQLGAEATDPDQETSRIAQDRLEGIAEVIGMAQEHADQGGDIESFLEIITLERSQQEQRSILEHDPASDLNTGRVTLSTIHAAKGLEWNRVFVVGFDQGIMPAGMSFENETAYHEERRVAFVAITRAVESLTLTRARRRRFGSEWGETQPSEYLKALEPHIVEVRQQTNEQPIQDVQFPQNQSVIALN